MLELLTLPFFERALLVGLILGVAMAILSVFVVVRRLSFFADAIGHSALTGIAIGLLVSLNPFVAALIFSLLVAVGLSLTRRHSRLPLDTLLGIFFSASVALGVILISLNPSYQTDLIGFLFGDILAVNNVDIIMSSLLVVLIGAVMLFAGKAFISITFNQDLAQAEGIAVSFYELLFLLLLAGTIALAIKIVGIALITALLVIPGATAQNVSRSLFSLFTISLAVSLLAIVLGMVGSAAIETAPGPTIALSGSLLFAISLLVAKLRH